MVKLELDLEKLKHIGWEKLERSAILSAYTEKELHKICCPKPYFQCENQMSYYRPQLFKICYLMIPGGMQK